ncbi:MAG: hypothetical protein NC311_15710 [Muribaculaceae bacterium]|nr:hypothetical protein [Muribaculaceae bacterium]
MGRCRIERQPSEPSKREAYFAVGASAACVLACTFLKAPIQFGVLAGAAAASLCAMRLGWTWQELEKGICGRIGKLGDTMLIMWCIGLLMGTMLYSGLLPMLVYYGFELVSPKFLSFGALLACMLMSTCTGSSWTAAGTAGVACMALAHGHGADPAVMAGMCVAGSVFGDKISPMSETTNLAPACCGTGLYQHIKSQLWTTVPAILIAAGLGLVLGAGLDPRGADLPEMAVTIQSQLGALYTFTPWLLLPIGLLLVLSFLKCPAVPVMILCSAANLILGRAVQGMPIPYGFQSAINGFKFEYLGTCDFVPHEKVLYVLERGGMASMVSIIMICFCGFALTTVLTEAGFMSACVAPLAKNLDRRWKAMLSAEVAILSVAAMAGISYMSSVFVGEAWREPFDRNNMGRQVLSRTLEDVGTCCTAIIPWCSSAAFFSGALGVGAMAYLPYCVLPFACPAVALILSILGKGMYPDGCGGGGGGGHA